MSAGLLAISVSCWVGGQFVSSCSEESATTEDFLVVSEYAVKSSEKSNWLRANEKLFFPFSAEKVTNFLSTPSASA